MGADVRDTDDLKAIIGDGVDEVRSLDFDRLYGQCKRSAKSERSEEKTARLHIRRRVRNAERLLLGVWVFAY